MSNPHDPEGWPTDTDDSFYVVTLATTLADILQRAKEKWPDSTPEQLTIEAEHIHLYCLSYDQYDASDWGMFLKISLDTTASMP